MKIYDIYSHACVVSQHKYSGRSQERLDIPSLEIRCSNSGDFDILRARISDILGWGGGWRVGVVEILKKHSYHRESGQIYREF